MSTPSCCCTTLLHDATEAFIPLLLQTVVRAVIWPELFTNETTDQSPSPDALRVSLVIASA